MYSQFNTAVTQQLHNKLKFNVSCELVNHQLIQNSAVVTENGPILKISVHPPTLWKRPQAIDVIDIYLQATTQNKQHKNVC